MHLNKMVVLLSIMFISAAFTFFHTHVSEAREDQGTGTVIIDVRTPEEYNSGHIEGAVNINYTDIGSEIESLVPDKDTTILLYCGSGHRAGIAKNTLEEMGYTKVINEGGYNEFRKKLKDM